MYNHYVDKQSLKKNNTFYKKDLKKSNVVQTTVNNFIKLIKFDFREI